MAVHFKFRSAVEYDSVSIEGNCISIAHLKDKIVEQKNLGKGTDFDLVITDAQTGEEYAEDTFLVPKNTSVIIKRVPARRAKATLLVNDQYCLEDIYLNAADMEEASSKKDCNGVCATLPPLPATVDELYDMDDFGVDLYAIDESALTHVEVDENNDTSALAAKTTMDGKRLPQEINGSSWAYGRSAFGRGFTKGSNNAVPPPGYVCHRCGQPGHFIQHCPTNGDPAFDIKRGIRGREQEVSSNLADGSMAAIHSEKIAFVKDAEPIPPELRCSLCQKIFKEAVMVPCCHYSFCDACIRQALVDKGKCPQCESTKLGNGDLLPNIALRQAIDRFTDSQLHVPMMDEGASKRALDGESATKAKASLPGNVELCKSSVARKDVSTAAMENESNMPIVADSVCESAVGLKERSVVEGNRVITQAADPSVASKKKKKHTRPTPIDVLSENVIGKPRKMDRLCYLCGSPDHLARHCSGSSVDNITTYPQQRGMFRPVGPVPPPSIAPYGQDMYWHGRPILHVRPLPMGYGEGVCPAMPFDPPVIPVAPYGVASYMPPMYTNPPMHGGFFSGIGPGVIVPRERPLSREEFMELQERERRRRITQERQEREHADDKAQSTDWVGQSRSSDSEPNVHKLRPSGEKHASLSKKRDIDHKAAQNYSDDDDEVHSKSKNRHMRKHVLERLNEHILHHRSHNASDNPDLDDSKGHRIYSDKMQRIAKACPTESRRSNKQNQGVVFERGFFDEEDIKHKYSAKTRASREEGLFMTTKQSSSSKYDTVNSEKHEQSSPTKYDGHRMSLIEPSSGEGSHSSRHRGKRATSESPKHTSHDERIKTLHCEQEDEGTPDLVDRHRYCADFEYDHEVTEPEKKHIKRKRHGHSKHKNEDVLDYGSGEEIKKKKKHKKHKSEGIKDAATDIQEKEFAETTRQRRQKTKSGKHKLVSTQNIEDTRWQMADSIDDDYCCIDKDRYMHR